MGSALALKAAAFLLIAQRLSDDSFFPAMYAQINLSPFYFSWLGKAVGQPFFFLGWGHSAPPERKQAFRAS